MDAPTRTVHSATPIVDGHILTQAERFWWRWCWSGYPEESESEDSDDWTNQPQNAYAAINFRLMRVLETLRLDRAAGEECLRLSLLVLERRAHPRSSRTSSIATLIAGTVEHEPAVFSLILAYTGVTLRHAPNADVLNIAPAFVDGGPHGAALDPAPAWVVRLGHLPFEDIIDARAWVAHYGRGLVHHARLWRYT